ncbi:MAG: bifunctional alpha,alpha-trehalose-phosphate synthase (UDP-forming)/trehalose-phosphatase [Candidatus Goldiibacteriota bacterium]
MKRLIIVSNRLPVEVTKKGAKYDVKNSVGGVATGLSSLDKSYQRIWIGWPGDSVDNEAPAAEKKKISRKLAKDRNIPVFLNNEIIENYYYGYSNRTIWSNFHYFMRYTEYRDSYWENYVKANEEFCKEILKQYKPGDTIWIHDYQLMLLPSMVREKIPNATIGFFLHIPFPAYETFSALPERYEILKGMLGADLIGFHTYHYAENFLNSVRRITGHEHMMNQLMVENRVIRVDSFPMGINYGKFSEAVHDKNVKEEVKKLKKGIGGKKVILSMDRLDYTKGIPERVDAFGGFLEKYPEYREKVVLVLVAVPSRTKVPQYNMLKKELDEVLSRVNGRFGTIGWVPILYFYRSFQFDSLAALYSVSDIALITPLRDGMNLVAKEYVAVKQNDPGVLVLSEKAGASSELGEAITVNPFDRNGIIESLKEAFDMEDEEKKERFSVMQGRLKRYDVKKWTHDFIERLYHVKELQKELDVKQLDAKVEDKIVRHYKKAKKRLIALDYDGTLRSFVKNPENAGPEADTLNILKKLAKDEKNEVVILSGRKRGTLEKWFGKLNLNLIAEHGIWIKEKAGAWKMIEPLSGEWKDEIRPTLELFVDRTPGSFIEEKDFSLVWHYRGAETNLGEIRSRDLKDAIMNLTANRNLGVLGGNKVVEIKSMGINKGRAVMFWLSKENWDIIFAAGDDWTDEDTFEAMPEDAFTVKVGFGYSKANYNLSSVHDVKKLLKKLAR